MARIPFIAVRIVSETEDEIVDRLRAVAERRRRRAPEAEDDGPPHFRLVQQARAILARRRQRTGVTHLRREDATRLAVLKHDAELAELPDPHAADVIAAEIHADMPWMRPATELVWRALQRAALHGAPIRIPPMLLVGPTGIGKSVWARRLAGHLGLPAMAVEATSENAGFGITGLQTGWGSARIGRVLELILQHRIANPLVFVDEIEKAGRASSTSGATFDLTASLLPLMEPATARAWTCPYFRVGFDMSRISWTLAANSLRGLSEPFLSRLEVIHLPPLTRAELCNFARREARRRGLSEASADAIVAALEAVGPRSDALSLRTVLRMLDRAELMERRPILH
ncbi:MAG: AAA family ATPase [Alkalilacustris sp.]